jgi:hypothetical protein
VRYKSKLRDGLQVYAVAGTNTVSFGIKADQAARSGLLRFAIERIDPAKNETLRGLYLVEDDRT